MIGKTLDKYEIVQRLGQGGMAEVYKAYQANLNRYVALKLIKASVSERPDYRARFEREAQSAARLDHPNIVHMYDLNIDAETGRPYMVMELIEGEPLNEYVEKREAGRQPLTVDETAAIAGQVCDALAYAHAHGVIHRDIKPGNIMRERTGRIILTDFGLAKLEGSASLTRSDMTIGTPDYMSPEQAVGRPVDRRTDLYSLGIVLFQLLTGCLPFVADTPNAVALKRCTEPVPDPRQYRPDLPASLVHIVMHSMGQRPDDRYQSADELRADLQRAIAGRPVQTAAIPAQVEWDRGAIRQLLNDAFDDQEIRTLCFDYFPSLYEHLGDGMSKADKIQALLEFCVRHQQFELLTEVVQKLNPAQYERYAPRLRARTGPTPPAMTPKAEEKRPSITAPFLAPRELTHIVGRETEVDDIVQTLTSGAGNRLCCLTGMGGIGKTSLAAHVAHRLREHSGDGVLWGDVYHSEPLTILDTWARAFECDFSSLPDLDSRAAALRNVLANKRVLVVLDDVWSADRARPLLPNGDECAVLITTRDVEVAAALNLIPYTVKALSPFESYQLLANILRNDPRLAAEKAAADEICALLAHLPLAVEIAGQRILSRPNWKLADMAQRLRDEHTRLGELKVSNREVRASFELSWNVLDDDQRRCFAALGVFEGRTFTVPALAAAADQAEPAARGNLDSLVALSLLDEEGATHYHQHPLLADYAREKLGQDQAAYARTAEYYLSYSQERKNKYAELEAEWNNIWAGLQVAYQQKMWQVVLDYAEALKDMWFARGRYSDARQVYEWACAAAEAIPNRQALSDCLLHWGQACIEQKDYAEATKFLSAGLKLCETAENPRGVASHQYFLARIALEQNKPEEAQRLLNECRRIRQLLNDTIGIAETLYMEGRVLFRSGDYDRADKLARQALDIQETANDKLGTIQTLRLLTKIMFDKGVLDIAEDYGLRALALCTELEDRGEQAMVLEALSNVHRKQNRLEAAQENAQKALDLIKTMGDREAQALLLYQLSLINKGKGQYALALDVGLQSLAIAKELEDALLTAYLLTHIGDYYEQLGQLEQARQQWLEALRIARAIKHPLATQEAELRLKKTT